MDEEEPTQPSTQIVIDPRRLGQGNSGLNNDDLTDIFCILHPISAPALHAAAVIHRANSQYTISIESDVKIREKNGGAGTTASDLASQGLVPCDIALRLSANVKDPAWGFVIGRNAQRCDFVIGSDDEIKRVSNIHFRIYINEHGFIMLEDQSTNGTAVNGNLLRAKEKENGHAYRHMLEQGSVIVLTMTPPERDFKFVVRIPQRDEDSETLYEQNLIDYLQRVEDAKHKKLARAPVANGKPVNLFPTPSTAVTGSPSMSSISRNKEWRGGSKYNKVGVIGKGAFAVVYKITAKFDGVPFAAKELEKRRYMKNGILDHKMDMEMKIMESITHPNIVKFIEHIDWVDHLYIIMEYVPEGDLGSLVNRGTSLPEAVVKTMAIQIVGALKYLHAKGITHRDIKPDNILIQKHDPFHVKLTDFGLSKMIDNEDTFLRTFCGTLLYCAPEVYSEYREYDLSGQRNLRHLDKKTLPPQRYGHAVDIWSLAGVLFFALCGSPPYPVKNGTIYQELLNHIMTQPLDIRPLQNTYISEAAIRFVRSMLHIRPEYRATIEQLEQSPWFTGHQVQTYNEDESQEVEMANIEAVDPSLELGASQLSIGGDLEVLDSVEVDFDDVSDKTEIQRAEATSNNENANPESFARPPGNHVAGRLFGEVNLSAVGSSSAIPFDELHLPSPNVNSKNTTTTSSPDSHFAQSNPLGSSAMEDSNQSSPVNTTNTMPPPLYPRSASAAVATREGDGQASRSSSLMGAESLVGHLNMRSPVDTPSPGADSLSTTHDRDNTVSLRRSRDDDEDEPWEPADLPPRKRRRSEREIEMVMPSSVFWDSKDRSTHHNNYPVWTNLEIGRYREHAESKGEEFKHGFPFFEKTMHSFRNRSPSLEPDASGRARSVPTHVHGPWDTKVEYGYVEPRPRRRKASADEKLPFTAAGSDVTKVSNVASKPDEVNDASKPSEVKTPLPSSQPVIGNDFLPRRILAKLTATSDSSLPTVAMNVTETITSWGRGENNTIVYANSEEIKVSKYAFKLFLFKPGYYTRPEIFNAINRAEPWKNSNGQDQDLALYISTKATSGILVNGIEVPSYDRQNPNSVSKHWGEVRHGDIITVWKVTTHTGANLHQRFKVECFWGKSKEPRKEGETFELLKEGDVLAELDKKCLALERVVFKEREEKQREEERMEQKAKEEAEKVREPSAFNQSFAGTPPA